MAQQLRVWDSLLEVLGLIDPLELGLEMTMSHHVGAGTQT